MSPISRRIIGDFLVRSFCRRYGRIWSDHLRTRRPIHKNPRTQTTTYETAFPEGHGSSPFRLRDSGPRPHLEQNEPATCRFALSSYLIHFFLHQSLLSYFPTFNFPGRTPLTSSYLFLIASSLCLCVSVVNPFFLLPTASCLLPFFHSLSNVGNSPTNGRQYSTNFLLTL